MRLRKRGSGLTSSERLTRASSSQRDHCSVIGEIEESGGGEIPSLGGVAVRDARCGSAKGSNCSGVLLLAETGLLDGKDVTIRLDVRLRFAATFPKFGSDLPALIAAGYRQ